MNFEKKYKRFIKSLIVRLILIRYLIWDLGLILDGRMYNFVISDGIINWERYKELWNTPLWRTAKKIHYILNFINGVPQPKWVNSAFHHENPIPFEHLCTQGYIIEKKDHVKGGKSLYRLL